MHELQKQFASEEGEAAWNALMHEHFHTGSLDEAQAYLVSQLEALGTELATRCLIDDPNRVNIAGWDELCEAIDMHEGDPISGVTLAIANEADRAFEKGQVHHPYMMLGLYTDEHFTFSGKSGDELVAEASSAEGPAWAGYDEDIEVFLECEGLDAINTALVHHKERHFFRDEMPDQAPKRYVEYVLACWWRALLFHRAVEKIVLHKPLPHNVPVLAGMVDMKPDVMAVHGEVDGARPAPRAEADEESQMAEMLPAAMITRREVEEVKEPPSGTDLRRRVSETAVEEPQKKSLMARIFGR